MELVWHTGTKDFPAQPASALSRTALNLDISGVLRPACCDPQVTRRGILPQCNSCLCSHRASDGLYHPLRETETGRRQSRLSLPDCDASSDLGPVLYHGSHEGISSEVMVSLLGYSMSVVRGKWFDLISPRCHQLSSYSDARSVLVCSLFEDPVFQALACPASSIYSSHWDWPITIRSRTVQGGPVHPLGETTALI